MIDILISYSTVSDNPDYTIPLAMYAVEIENPLGKRRHDVEDYFKSSL